MMASDYCLKIAIRKSRVLHISEESIVVHHGLIITKLAITAITCVCATTNT